MLQGPDPEVDGVSTGGLIDLCRIVRERFGVTYSEKCQPETGQSVLTKRGRV